MKLSVIIVSYNVRYYLEQCLHSLFIAASGYDYEVFVVDNASSDGTVGYLRKQFPSDHFHQLHIIANSRNVGFGRANNIAYKQSKGEFVLYLNPDTVLTEKTLLDCFEQIGGKEDVGGVGVRMLKADGSFALESRRGLPTPFTAFCKMSGLASLFPKSKILGRYYMRYQDEHKVNQIDVISGAFMMVRRKALEKCGVFDETFFMYGEDIDLSYRLQKGGYINLYIPTPILHYKGESTQKSSYRYVHIFYEAMLIFFNKHYNHYSVWFSLPIRLAIYLRAVLALITQQTDKLKVMLRLTGGPPEDRFLIIGGANMIAEVKNLCEKWVLNATYIVLSDETITHYNGHEKIVENVDDYKYIVYDIENIGFGKTLSFFEHSEHHNLLGLYSTKTNRLITPHNVFE